MKIMTPLPNFLSVARKARNRKTEVATAVLHPLQFLTKFLPTGGSPPQDLLRVPPNPKKQQQNKQKTSVWWSDCVWAEQK